MKMHICADSRRRQGYEHPHRHPRQDGRQARGGRAQKDPRTAVWDQVAPMVCAGDSDNVVRQEHRQEEIVNIEGASNAIEI